MCERLLANPVIEAYEVTIIALEPRVSVRSASCSSRARTASSTCSTRSSSSAATPSCCGTATTPIKGVDAVVVPGGFAHGDYLRTGAIARFSPVMHAVGEFAAAGGPVVGICNGFQVLCEAHLLPGALQKNAGLKFLCETVELRVETTSTALTNAARGRRSVLRIPINHFEGNYVCDERDARRAAGRGPRRRPLRRQPQRQPRRHRRASATTGRNVVGLDAAPRARLRRAARFDRRRRAAEDPARGGGRTRIGVSDARATRRTPSATPTSRASGSRSSPTRSRRRPGGCSPIFPPSSRATCIDMGCGPGTRPRCCASAIPHELHDRYRRVGGDDRRGARPRARTRASRSPT